MASGMYLRQRDGNLVPMREEGYACEDDFQALLAEYPELLGGEQIDPNRPRRWILVTRELGIADRDDAAGSRWSLDHCFLDQDAIPTLVEVKRSTDTRLRREVVGQLLEYAANTKARMDAETLRRDFERNCALDGGDPATALRNLLGDEPDAVDFWERVEMNLRAGRIRLLFVADAIPQELLQIIEFLNSQMERTEVLAVEVKQYVGAGAQTLVPQVKGQTAGARQRRVRGRPAARDWDEASFLAAMRERNGDPSAETARAILRWAAERRWTVTWGRGATTGSCNLAFEHADTLCRVAHLSTDDVLVVAFARLGMTVGFRGTQSREELRERLNAIEGVDLGEDVIARYPTVPLAALHGAEARQALFEALQWVEATVRGVTSGGAQ